MGNKKKILTILDFFTIADIPGYLFLAIPIVSFFTNRQRDLGAYASIDTSAIIQSAYLFLIFTVVFNFIFLSKKDNPELLFKSPQKYLFLYILVCFISMIWSQNIFITGYRAFEALTYLMLITLVVQRLIRKLSFQNVIEWAILWITWSIFWSVLSAIKWAGLDYLLWPFNSSRLAVPMFFFLAIFLTKRKLNKYLIIAFTILSFSNKVFFGIAFGMLGFLFGNVKYRGLFLIIGFAVAISYTIWGELIVQNTLFYGREGIGMEYTSGRDKLMELSWEAITKNPLLGYGFVSGESELIYQTSLRAISTHNFILSGLIGTGVFGTILLILYFISAFRIAISKVFEKNKWKAAFASTIIMATIVSLTSPGIGFKVYGSWVPVVLVITIISGINYKADKVIMERELKQKTE